MASPMVYEKFWSDKSAHSDAERRHFESLAKARKGTPLMLCENVWIDKRMYGNAERQYYEKLAKLPVVSTVEELITNEGICKYTESLTDKVVPKITQCTETTEVTDKKVAVKAKEMPPKAAAPEVVIPEKSSKRRRRNKGSVGHSESSNKGDSISEAPPQCIEEVVVPVPAKENVQPKPKESNNKSKSDKKQKNKNDKNNMKLEETLKIEEVCEAQPIVTKGGNAQVSGQCSLASEVAKARQHIKKSLECMDSVLASVPNSEVAAKTNSVAIEVAQISSALNDLRSLVLSLKSEVEELKRAQNTTSVASAKPAASKPAPVPSPKDEPDDGVDLFASDSEDEDAAKIKEERLAAYAAKKSKKPILIAKSNIILDCKPWDDETDMPAMEAEVRKIVADGLLWGASKFVPLAYGIRKLQISCVVEDDKVSIDWLQEEIEKIEDFIQSCDIAAFNKV